MTVERRAREHRRPPGDGSTSPGRHLAVDALRDGDEVVPRQRDAHPGVLRALLVDGHEVELALAWVAALGWELLAREHVRDEVWRLHLHDPHAG